MISLNFFIMAPVMALPTTSPGSNIMARFVPNPSSATMACLEALVMINPSFIISHIIALAKIEALLTSLLILNRSLDMDRGSMMTSNREYEYRPAYDSDRGCDGGCDGDSKQGHGFRWPTSQTLSASGTGSDGIGAHTKENQ